MKQITVGEMVMVIVGPLVGTACYVASEWLLVLWLNNAGLRDPVMIMLFFYTIVATAPCFVLVFVSGLLQSWRYKIVNAVLSVFVLVAIKLRLAVKMVDGLEGAVFGSLLVAVGLTTGIVALGLWRRLRANVARTRGAVRVVNPVLESEPRASGFLRGLALVSVPLVFVTLASSTLITLGFSALLLYLLSLAPRVPVALLAAGFFAPILALWANFAAIRSIVSPRPLQTLSVELPAGQHAAIRRLVDEVAADVGTQTADHVILNAQPGFFVTQARVQTMDGVIAGRILSLGLPSLRDLTAGQLRSVLAHEFAHFSGKDTAYSRFVAPVYRGIGSAVGSLGKGTSVGGLTGAAIAVLQLPALRFMMSFADYFAVIDSMLSRSRELRADWIAARRYGKRDFVSALEKVSVNGPLFDAAVSDVQLERADELFQKVAARMSGLAEERGRIEAELDEYTETEFDTHPSFRTRRESLPEDGRPAAAGESALDGGLGELEKRLSAHVVERLGMTPAGA